MRQGEATMELFETGEIDTEILFIPVYQYTKGVDRAWPLDLWYGRGQSVRDADDLRLSVFALGATNDLGKEVADNGYLEVKKSSDPTYTPLAAGVSLSLGLMAADSMEGIDFKLSIPGGAASTGRLVFGLRLTWLWSVLYGDTVFGLNRFGAISQTKDLLMRVQIA